MVAIVPIVAIPAPSDTATLPYYGGIYRSTYNGTISFHNIFEGKLPASDYPKLNVRAPCSRVESPDMHPGARGLRHRALIALRQLYFYLSAAYVLLAGVWAWLCYCNVQDVLSVHVRLSRQTTSTNWAD